MLYTVRHPGCAVCGQDLIIDNDHRDCFERECSICECPNGDHWTTNDGEYAGCAGCTDCEGFVS